VGNLFENAGVLVKHGIVDSEIFCDLWGGAVIASWEALEEFTANRRVVSGDFLYENFEYLVLYCERFTARYPNGTLPKNRERKKLPEPWPSPPNSAT
jgi:hypothetical protein